MKETSQTYTGSKITVYRDNMRTALHLAIESLTQEEKRRGYSMPSANLATLHQMLAVINDGGKIELRD